MDCGGYTGEHTISHRLRHNTLVLTFPLNPASVIDVRVLI